MTSHRLLEQMTPSVVRRGSRLGSRRVHVAGCTANPDGSWVAQQARQLAWSLPELATPARFLIHDRDGKFTRAFKTVVTLAEARLADVVEIRPRNCSAFRGI